MPTTRDRSLTLLASHDLVGLEAELGRARPVGAASSAAPSPHPAAARRRRGARRGARAWAAPRSTEAVERVGETYEAHRRARASPSGSSSTSACCATSATTRGAILEVYDPALGHVLGGGGRYDGLMSRFGGRLPAVGFALYLERVHVAQTEEERIAEEGRR